MTRPASDHAGNDQDEVGPSQQADVPLRSAVDLNLHGAQHVLNGITAAQDTSLTDLPNAWLLQLASSSTPDTCLSAFQTCRAMRDLMLSQRRRVRTKFRLPLAPGNAAADAAQAALQRVCQLAANAVLRFYGVGANPSSTTASAGNLITNTMSSLGHPLSAITSVELRGLGLDGLVPAWLRSACPNMTSLTLDACLYSSLPDPTISIQACAQLQELCLMWPPQLDSSQLTVANWKHQLRSLINLQRLSIDWGTAERVEGWMECCSSVGTHLSELHVPWLRVDDNFMEALLGMPSLKKLWFMNTVLTRSYAQRPCTWTDVHLTHLTVEQFPRWPLSGKPSLHATSGGTNMEPDVVMSHDLQVTGSAVAVIRDCGGIQWGAVDYVGLWFPDADDATDACLAATLPILSGCRASRLKVMNGRMTPSLLATLKPHLASLPETCIDFQYCQWRHPGVFELLLPSLPAHVHTLRLNMGSVFSNSSMTEAQLTEVCAHACRAVVLQVLGVTVQLANGSKPWREGWQQRVKDAMRAAGHEHVTLR